MKSSDDELNDAIRNALKDSFSDFERKPKASVDERIYKELGRQTNRKPLWGALGLVALVAVLFFWYRNTGKDNVAIGLAKPKAETAAEKATADLDDSKIKANEKSVETASKAPLKVSADRRMQSERLDIGKSKRLAVDKSKSKSLETDKSQHFETDKSELLEIHKTEHPDVRKTYLTEADAVARQSDDVADLFDVYKLNPHGNLKYQELTLPSVTAPITASKTDSASPEVADKQPAGSWKPAMLVNFSATNTSQSVYLLPSAHSRILKVSFPNSIANIGYKIGFGMQVKGYQVLISYSHLQYQTEYVYALDEFAAEPADAAYNFKRLGAARTVKSVFDMAGVGAKKNFDFHTKALGALYAQLGMEYSRSVMGPGQQLLSASVAAGKRIFTSPKTNIVIGPFFEYNILRMMTSEENVKIRPNQVGISLGVKFAN